MKTFDPMPSRNHWPLLLIVLIAAFLALTGWSFHRAARGASAVTDADYYSHGLRYDQTLLEQKAAATLGWDMQLVLTGRQLQVTLRDRQQQPVTAARGTMTVSGSRQSQGQSLALAETAAGIYTGQFPSALRGETSAQVDFELDGARLSRRLLLALP